jgi:hypothetical protein
MTTYYRKGSIAFSLAASLILAVTGSTMAGNLSLSQSNSNAGLSDQDLIVYSINVTNNYNYNININSNNTSNSNNTIQNIANNSTQTVANNIGSGRATAISRTSSGSNGGGVLADPD